MAIITLSSGANEYQFWPDLLGGFNAETYTIDRTATSYTVTVPQDGHPAVVRFTGTGFEYTDGDVFPEGRPIEGVVTGMTITINEQVWFTATGLSRSLADVDHIWAGFSQGDPNAPNSNYHFGDSFGLFSYLLAGNDKIFGSIIGEDMIAGLNPGNDSLYGGGGHDYIKADIGSDLISGGAGFDTYSLSQSFFEISPTRGAIVNLLLGTVTDCWGGKDKLLSIEEVEGSRFRDTFTGNGASSNFVGLKGRDIVDGGAGFDTIRYDKDVRYGGQYGVNVNLTTGVARDGWGNIDTLKNIEAVRGTLFSDVLTGNAVANDLYGGERDDTLSGNGGNDKLVGGAGEDRMSGGTGADQFIYNDSNGGFGFGDTITDFVSGVDKLVFETRFFEGMSNSLLFSNATAAATTGSSFYFDTATDNLYWDQDGSDVTIDAVIIATLTGVSSLTSSDFVLI